MATMWILCNIIRNIHDNSIIGGRCCAQGILIPALNNKSLNRIQKEGTSLPQGTPPNTTEQLPLRLTPSATLLIKAQAARARLGSPVGFPVATESKRSKPITQ